MNMIEDTYIELPRNLADTAVVSGDVFSTPEKDSEMTVRVGNRQYTIIAWGADNQLPYTVKDLIEKNSVMAQNKFFNTLTCYGRGLEYMDLEAMDTENPKPTSDAEIRKWWLRNNVKRFFAEQIVDIKYYFFSVAVIILDRERRRIVRIVHKDACHCRFEKADEKTGRIENVLYADWKDNDAPEYVEVIPLLDEQDPIGDLLARTGKEPDTMGYFKLHPRATKFAIVCKMPTPGCQYYPVPSYSAVFRDGWYDIYGLLTAAKKAKIRNGQNIRYHVEINTQFWENRAREEGISMGTPKFQAMKTLFIQKLKEYLGGSKNSDKMIWSEFEALMDGKEKHYIKINVVDTTKAGNEYNDDVAEASNVLCYDDNVHPNLAGATPGKSQMNNSGSDKRELFTMKQTLETLPHDILMTVHHTVIWFNGWQDKVTPVVPLILLTTLDKHTDAQETIIDNTNTQGNGNT